MLSHIKSPASIYSNQHGTKNINMHSFHAYTLNYNTIYLILSQGVPATV